MKQIEKSWQPDATQQAIIDCHSGYHLVLAPPGCGKTQILAERIRRAHGQGVAYGDMLCLTFTNRAARGMRERIATSIADRGADEVFVGNVHRYCARFLFENGIVPAESAVIDDDTMVSILAMYLQEDELAVLGNPKRRRAYTGIMFFSHLMYELRHGIDKELRLHPEAATPEDIAVMQAICRLEGKAFTAEMMMDIYDHNDYYVEVCEREDFDYALRQTARQTLEKMKFAHAYEAYKTQRHLLDFEDLLEMTYVALHRTPGYRRYAWIQVDEVQDLNLMQLAIIDLLSASGAAARGGVPADTDAAASASAIAASASTVMYLGDEQQAIFSFMGAKQKTLDLLKQRCAGHVHHLGVNHRSPRYLVDLLNTYATHLLHADPDLLPQADNDVPATSGTLQIVGAEDVETECADVARMAVNLAHDHPQETTAIIVNANADADKVAERLTALAQPHFKVSGVDLFATDEVKLVLAHLSVLTNERNFLAWSRLLKGMKVCQTSMAARRLVHQLNVRAIAMSDLFDYEGTTYLQQFVQAYDTRDIIVFDTETTGLNVFEDDVVQIAAERIRQGMSVAKFSVHIETDREIPLMLGDVPNPIIEERRHQRLYRHDEALRMFLDFAGDAVILGHNADYDYRIMQFNVERYLPGVEWSECFPGYFDSLKLIRLLRPDLKAYKLKLLLEELELEGENSHLADDDVNATVSLVRYCRACGAEMVASQQEFLARQQVQDSMVKLRSRYGQLYTAARGRLYVRQPREALPAIISEMQGFVEAMAEGGWAQPQERMDYIYRFMRDDVLVPEREPSLIQQLENHITEMTTFKEADLCGSASIDDRIFVTTIHKAKGLEFDNVIVYDVIEGRLPSFYNEHNPVGLAEDARKLYVAMSRAKRRLIITYSRARLTAWGIKPQQLSRFLTPILPLFEQNG